ncbi:SWIM zinc finger family protein [Burkholderia multivorans]|uniref:SWIM zinc finger family protein n=1 Tax=Burkholderia multivorans TaxID=87883 RepID=UPI0019045414|nr:SWIM zinc finger family protein [Burkholderia multivorans]MBJ9620489.1 SWIM zinc finger family protein [Burkholderia multivorans]
MMEKIVFTVQGAAARPYELTFESDGNRIVAFCTCPAGENGTYCKHRLSILTGTDPGIVSGNVDQIESVKSWLPGSHLALHMAELAEAERSLEQAKSVVANAKKKLSATMMGR